MNLARATWLCMIGALAGCPKVPTTSMPDLAEATLIEHATHRDVPPVVRSRFSIKMRSPKLGIAAPPLGGGLVIERPSHAYLAIFPPVGAPVLTAAVDGRTLRLLNAHDRQYVEETDAAAKIGRLTHGALALDDVIDLLLGLLPLDKAHITGSHRDKAGWRLAWSPVDGYDVRAWLDPALGTARRIEVLGAGGKMVADATYEPFEQVQFAEASAPVWMPTRMHLVVPSVELTIDLHFKTWSALETAPDVFAPVQPEGWRMGTFEDFGKGVSTTTGELGGEDADASP